MTLSGRNFAAGLGTLALFAGVCLGIQNAQAADYVLLKNGTHLEGELLEDKPGTPEVTFNTGLKNVHILRTQIKKLYKDENVRKEYVRRAGLIRGQQQAQSHYDLYIWAKSKRLYSFAETELETTIAADPNHAEARKALGHVFKNGQWLTEEEAEADAYENETATAKNLQIAHSAPLQPASKEERIALNRKVVGMAKKLARSDVAKSEKEQIVSDILGNRAQMGEIFLSCLDYRLQPEAATRQGALKGIAVAKPTGLTASTTLAWTAVKDPSTTVRDEAVGLIMKRKDDKAIGGIMRQLVDAFDKRGNVLNAPIRDAAVKALRRIDDPRIVQGLLYYVVLEMRPTVTELVNFNTRQIDSFTINQGASVSVIIPLSFPIQFPELAITKVRTTVCAPASAVRAVTGQNFATMGEWMKWAKARK